MRHFKLAFIALLIVVLFAAVLPAAAAPGATINSIAAHAASCTITLSFTVQDAGFYAVNVWDDGTFKAGAGINMAAGSTATVTISFGVVLQGAAGLGLYVENGVGLASTATFASNGGFQPNAPGCTGAYSVSLANGVCSHPQPLDYVVRPVPGGAPAYFEPAADKQTNFALPAGTWYTSPTPVDGYYEVWIACEGNPIFIPAEFVG